MTCYIGEIRAFAGNFAPVNWALCNGTQLQINAYQQLYSLIGTTFGGDGVSTFKLPDLRGKIVVNRGTSVSGTPYPLGVPGGVESVYLNNTTMPSHSHTFNVIATEANTNSPQNNVIAEAKDTNSQTDMAIYLPSTADGAAPYSLHSSAIGNNETINVPHENRMPGMAINYIICLVGFYPSSS